MRNGKQLTDRKQVLLIEGDRRIRTPLEQLLIAYGHHVTAFESGEQGLRAIAHRYFNTVICNYQLPGISGLDFFQESRWMLTDTTTILTAPIADQCSANDAMAAGIAVFLEMPFKIENLLACIEGRFLDICARSFGRHLYITNKGKIMAISSTRRSEKPVTGTVDAPPLPKAIRLPGRRWKLYSNPNSASNGPLSHPTPDRKKSRHETGLTLADV
jgi:response regulator RpfG family c-di-GMP phosphodiesterase